MNESIDKKNRNSENKKNSERMNKNPMKNNKP